MPDENKTILVVDDDPKVRLLLRRCFETESYRIVEAENATEVESALDLHEIDLITLDLNLGAESGLEIAKNIRAKSDVPIIIVTGKGDIIDTVVGLELGADDYIAKPFHLREVLARARSVLRRSEGRKFTPVSSQSLSVETSENISDRQTFKFENWEAETSKFKLTDPHGDTCDLTTSDFKLLTVFLENPQRVLSRDHIMDQVNGHDWMPYDRTIDNQVARLRKKVEEDPANPKIIKTVRGIGYIFTADVTIS